MDPTAAMKTLIITEKSSQATTAAWESLARNKRVALPRGYDQDFDTCRRFLDANSKS